MMHLRRNPMVDVDFLRAGEFLCTTSCWIDNPKTNPKKEEVQEIVDRSLKTGAITTLDSPGKFLPIKGLVYLMLDQTHPLTLKFSLIHSETYSRFFKLILGKVAGTVAGKYSQKFLDNQLQLRTFVLETVAELGALIPIQEQYETDREIDPDFPAEFINSATALKTAFESEDDNALKEYLNPAVCLLLAQKLHHVLQTRGDMCNGPQSHWSTIQRIFYNSMVVRSYSIQDLKQTYADFKEPLGFLKHCKCESSHQEKINFNNIICSWLTQENGKFSFCSVSLEGQEISVHNHTTGTSRIATQEDVIQRLWPLFKQILMKYGHFRGREYAAHGLLEIDWAIVKALKNPVFANQLQGVQISEHASALAGKNKAYEKWIVRVQAPKLGHNSKVEPNRKTLSDKRRVSIVFLGEVDAGKSTTAGHVISQTGFLDPHLLKRFEQESRAFGKESCKFAWVMDRLKNEREMGVSIEVSFWSIMTENFEVDILDAPGHRKFFKNMATGASLADAAVLVVSAAPGEFEASISSNSMLYEEAFCAFAVGVRQFIVVVNKMDAVNYDESRFNNIRFEVEGMLKRMGVPLQRTIVLPISAFEGQNLTDDSDKFPWFDGWSWTHKDSTVKKGKTLLQAIDAIEAPERNPNTPLRIPILKKHKIPGIGTVVVGRVASGVLKAGQHLTILPARIDAQCNSIEIHHIPREHGGPGDFIGFNIKRADPKLVKRGMVAVDPSQMFQPCSQFVVRLVVYNWKHPIKAGWSCYVFCHTASFVANFATIVSKIDKRTGKVSEENPESITGGDAALVQLKADHPVCVEPFSVCPPLGRIICTQGGAIVALGVVMSIVEEVATKGPKVLPKTAVSAAKNPPKRK